MVSPAIPVPDVFIKDSPLDDGSVPSREPFWFSPDIWVDNPPYDGVPDYNPIAGQPSRLYARVHNIGNAPAVNVKVDFYYRDPATELNFPDGATFIGSQTIPIIPVGGSDSTWVTWNVPAVEPPWCVGVIAATLLDPQTSTFVNLDNNLGGKNLVFISTQPGKSVELKFKVENPCVYPATVELKLDTEELPKAWKAGLSESGLSLAPNESQSVVLTITPPQDAEPCSKGVVHAMALTKGKVRGGVSLEVIVERKFRFTIHLCKGINIISVPLDPSVQWRLSDLADHIGRDDVTVVIFYDRKENKFISWMPSFPPDSPTNKRVEGGDGFIVLMKQDKEVTFTGQAWEGIKADSAPSSQITNAGISTPIFIVEGVVIREDTGSSLNGVEVRVKNLMTNQSAMVTTGAVAGDGRYVVTLTDFTNSRAAQVGDVIEITTLDSASVPVNKLNRYTVTVSDVQQSKASLSDVLLMLIPKKSALLANYPNPFNPDTWIPYQLTEGADVTIRIYSITGQLVHRLDLGYKKAGFYLSKGRAAYWNGRNKGGEEVASGVYFYSIQASSFSATRKMVVLK